jgi:hypothetical protein
MFIYLFKKFSILILFCCFSVSFLSLDTYSQAQNNIKLGIISVTKNGQRENTRKINANSFALDGELGAGDDIRYQWEGVDLSTTYKNNPATGGGYIKLYNNTVSDDNFVGDFGKDNYPVKISEISNKLKGGENKLLFVYINSATKTSTIPVTFTFNFGKPAKTPEIKVTSPAPKTVFMQDLESPFKLELVNFELNNSQNEEPNKGKLKVYFNEVKQENFLGQSTNGQNTADSKYQVTIDPKNLDLKRIGDNPDVNLIFLLTNSNDKSLDISASLPVVLNYKNSLDAGLPKISILEPKKDRTDLVVKNDAKFILQITNFKTFGEVQNISNTKDLNQNEGYLQIHIIDGEISSPVQTIWGKNEFTLNEIGYTSKTNGQRKIKVQLVDKNFISPKPEVVDTIDIFYKSDVVKAEEVDNVVQNNSWRILIIALTILLVVGGITILITKG